MKSNNKLHDKEKFTEEYRIKDILEGLCLIDKDFIKSEGPDFIKDNVGLEVTQVNTYKSFDAFMHSRTNKKIDVLKYNKKAGGRIIEKNKPCGLAPENFDENGYFYILPKIDCRKSLEHTLNSKLDKLEKYQKLDKYLLAVYAPFIINSFNIYEYEKLIKNIQKNRSRKFSTVYIVTNTCIAVFNQTEKCITF